MSGPACGFAYETQRQHTVDKFEKDQCKLNAAVKI